MRSEIPDEQHCPEVPEKPVCGQCPKEMDGHDCDDVIYCASASKEKYARAAFQFNTAMPKNPCPCAVVMAKDTTCIKAAINYAKQHNLSIAVRGGRHSYIGASTTKDGVVVDVSRINHVQQRDKDSMTVGAGINLGHLYYELWNSTPRMLYPGGSCPTVGLSGLTLGGGQGVVGRKYGLSTDQVLEVKMVDAHGREVVANSTTNSHLFWALRGGGNGNFGVVYEFTLKRYKIPDVSVDYLISFPRHEWHRVFDLWQDLITDDEFEDDWDTWTQLTISPVSLHIAFHISGSPRQHYIDMLSDRTTPNITECAYSPANYSGSTAFWAGCAPKGKCGTTNDMEKCLKIPTDCGGRAFRMNSGYQSGKLGPDGIKTILRYMDKSPCSNATLQLDTLGGKINSVAPNDTAFPHRRNTVTYQFITYFDYNCSESEMVQWLDSFYKSMIPHMSRGCYRNYANPDLEDYNHRYFLENYPKLVQVKKEYDALNVFKYSQSIPLILKVERALLYLLPYIAAIVLLTIAVLILLHRLFGKRKHGHIHRKKQS